jgi:TRAP-type C4-dicarboxylate transport system substrate-binding protein
MAVPPASFLNLDKEVEVKRVIILIFTLLLLSAVIFGGCAQPAPAPAPAPAPTPTPAPTPVKPIEWRFATFIPPQDVYAQQMGLWASELEAATNGRIKVTFYHAESLIKMPDLFDAVAAGTADFAMIDANLTPERLALSGIMTLPMLFKHASQAQQTMWALLQKYKEFSDEYLPTKVIWCHDPGPTQLVGKKQMQNLDDLKGQKVAIVTPWEAKSMEALGMVPVSMPPTEMYTATERGVVDASSGDFNQAFIWKIYEITKYRTGNVEITQRVSPIIMNLNTYNNLPDDLKKIFDEKTDGLTWCKRSGEAYEAFDAQTTQEIKDYDAKVGNPPFYYLPADEKQRWLDKVAPVRDEWVNEMKAKGLPAEAMLKDLMAFAAQYQ